MKAYAAAARWGARDFTDVHTVSFGQLVIAARAGQLAAIGIMPVGTDQPVYEVVGRRDLAAEKARADKNAYQRRARAKRRAAGVKERRGLTTRACCDVTDGCVAPPGQLNPPSMVFLCYVCGNDVCKACLRYEPRRTPGGVRKVRCCAACRA